MEPVLQQTVKTSNPSASKMSRATLASRIRPTQWAMPRRRQPMRRAKSMVSSTRVATQYPAASVRADSTAIRRKFGVGEIGRLHLGEQLRLGQAGAETRRRLGAGNGVTGDHPAKGALRSFVFGHGDISSSSLGRFYSKAAPTSNTITLRRASPAAEDSSASLMRCERIPAGDRARRACSVPPCRGR